MDNRMLSGLLNPVRMKILQLFMTNETATVRKIAADMPDIPSASLYRHINKLVAYDILEICAENKIRGTIEKVYRLKNNPLLEGNQLFQKGNSEELFNVFYTFVMSLLKDFRVYLDTENYELENDRVGFRSYPLYLSDEESDEFLEDLKKSLIKIQNNTASNERRLRKFSFVILPGDEK